MSSPHIVIFNCSPHKHKGNTAKLLNPFVDGIKQVTGNFTIIYTHDLKISPCKGCYKCWFHTPGQCVYKDDMQQVIAAVKKADLWVIGAPLYSDNLPSTFKTVLDRLIPLSQPAIELEHERCVHPMQDYEKKPNIVLIASCGYWSNDNFKPLLAHVEALCRNFRGTFCGALLRAHAVLYYLLDKTSPVFKELENTARELGKQFAEQQRLDADKLNIISQQIFKRDDYIKQFNALMQKKVMREKAKAKKYADDEIISC